MLIKTKQQAKEHAERIRRLRFEQSELDLSIRNTELRYEQGGVVPGKTPPSELVGHRLQIVTRSGRRVTGRVRLKWIRCNRSGCTRCPHGPYAYVHARDGNGYVDRYIGRFYMTEREKNA